jgi:hypothetical protein
MQHANVCCPPICREGDLVTLSNRGDIQRAMQEAVEQAARSAGPRAQLTQQSLPPIRLQVVKVASEVSSAVEHTVCEVKKIWLVTVGWEAQWVGGARQAGRQAAVPGVQVSPFTATHSLAHYISSHEKLYFPSLPVAPQAEVPKIPDEEMAYVKQMLAQLQRAQDAQKPSQQPSAEEEAAPPVRVLHMDAHSSKSQLENVNNCPSLLASPRLHLRT